MSSWFTSHKHDVGMMSLHSHCICIAHVMSLHYTCDIIMFLWSCIMNSVMISAKESRQPDSLVSLKNNSIGHQVMLWRYIHHLVQDSCISVASDDPDYVLEPSNFLHTTFHQYMSWKLNEITTSFPSPPPSVTASSTIASPSPPSCSSQLLNLKQASKGISLPTLPSKMRNTMNHSIVLVTPRAHDCEEILQPTYRPRSDADSLELFWLKNDLMYSVFNKCLLTDMGKTIVRKHLDTKNAQLGWEDFAIHMTTSSKGKAKKCRLHTYVTTTVLDK